MREKQFYKQMFALVLPIAAQSFISALVGSADVVMLSVVGQSAISAVSQANQVTFILTLFYMGIATGTGFLAAQYWGKRDTQAIERVMGVSGLFSAGVSVLMFLVAFLFPKWLMSLLSGDAEVIALGAIYLQALSVSYLCMALSQVYLAVLKSMERTRLSALITSCSLLTNIGLNAVAIFFVFTGNPKGAIFGVAVATVIARAVECLWCLAHSATCGTVKLRLIRMVRPDRLLLGDFLKYAMPVLANYLVWGTSLTVIAGIMGHVGSDMVAANSVAAVVKNLVLVLCTGISQGGAILVGISLGKGDIAQARQRGGQVVKAAAIAGVVAGGLTLLVRPIALQMGSLSPAAQELLGTMLFVCAVYCVGKSVNSTVIGGIFCAGGDAKFGMLCDGIVMWGIMVPLGCILAFVVGVPPIWLYIILSLDEFLKLPFMALRYRKYKWLKNITREKTTIATEE